MDVFNSTKIQNLQDDVMSLKKGMDELARRMDSTLGQFTGKFDKVELYLEQIARRFDSLENEMRQTRRDMDEWKITAVTAQQVNGAFPYYGPSRTANTMRLTNVNEPYEAWRKEYPHRR